MFKEPGTGKPVESVTTMLASDTLLALTGAVKVSRIGALTSSVPVGQVTWKVIGVTLGSLSQAAISKRALMLVRLANRSTNTSASPKADSTSPSARTIERTTPLLLMSAAGCLHSPDHTGTARLSF